MSIVWDAVTDIGKRLRQLRGEESSGRRFSAMEPGVPAQERHDSVLARTIDDVLAALKVRQIDGPPRAYFEVGEGVERQRVAYTSYRYSYAQYGPLADLVLSDLSRRVSPGALLVWRHRIEVAVEEGGFKAYMRFAVVTDENIAGRVLRGEWSSDEHNTRMNAPKKIGGWDAALAANIVNEAFKRIGVGNVPTFQYAPERAEQYEKAFTPQLRVVTCDVQVRANEGRQFIRNDGTREVLVFPEGMLPIRLMPGQTCDVNAANAVQSIETAQQRWDRIHALLGSKLPIHSFHRPPAGKCDVGAAAYLDALNRRT